MEKIYPYAVSIIRTKENNMLSNTEFEQLATENNIERIKSVLIDKKYNFELITRIEDYEKVLKNEQEKLYKLVKELLEDESSIMQIFLNKINYYNLKMILKAKILNKDCKKNLNYSGSINPDDLLKIIEENKLDLLSQNMKEAVIEAQNKYNETKSPFMIDCILDKECFREMKEFALQFQNEFIVKYVQNLIDVTNIKTFFRIYKMFDKNVNIMNVSFIDGGTLTLNNLEESLKEDESNLKNQFGRYSNLVEEALNSYKNLDVYCDNYIMEYMKESKLKAITIEPIIAYIYAKECEIKNIRIIFTGKLNNMTSEKIKERLRVAYVK